ncbi:MAG: phosphotransferase [Acidimicrobiales bacterium]
MPADPPGPLLAAGRDCEIYAVGNGRVLRRARDGRSLDREAAIIRHVREHGYPAPEVFDARGPDLVMERISGPNLFDDAAGRPWRLRSNARVLAGLHQRLATIPVPDWLPAAEGIPGDAVLHLDLHPLNVLVSRHGPKVIDWTNAARGAAGAEIATTWLLMAAATLPETRIPRRVLEAARRRFLRSFLDAAGRDAARPWLAAVVELRTRDPHIDPAELDRMRRLATRERRPPTP